MSRPTVTHGGGEGPLTPTEQVVRDANRVVEVTDARGRKIGVRNLTTSVRVRVLDRISDRTASKGRLLAYFNTAAAVTSIDGESVDPLAGSSFDEDKAELIFRALIERLGDAGFEAIAEAFKDHFQPASVSDLKKELPTGADA